MRHRIMMWTAASTLTLIGCNRGPTSEDLPLGTEDSRITGSDATDPFRADLPDDAVSARSLPAPPETPEAESRPPSTPPLPPLSEAVIQPYDEWGLEETVADSLGRIGAPAVASLVRMLRHPEPARRVQAASILARIGPEAKDAVPGLIAALEDPDDDVRKAAARALGQIGPAAADAVGPLLQVLEEAGAPSERPETTPP